MKNPIRRFYEFLEQPIYPAGRALLAVLVIPLGLAFTAPLWRISMEAPQYPEGLYMDIRVGGLEGGNHGQHLQEINTLNHYIGMHCHRRRCHSRPRLDSVRTRASDAAHAACGGDRPGT